MNDLTVRAARTTILDYGPVTRPDLAGVEQPIDLTLTGTKLWFTVKRHQEDAEASEVFQKTYVAGGAAVGITVVGTGSKNTGTITVDPADVSSSPGKTWVGFYDLLLEEPGGRRSSIDDGAFKVFAVTAVPA